jgi:hypothetical protein
MVLEALDDLSGWALPPPAARAEGDVEPVRVFDSAEAAVAFLAGAGKPRDARPRRVLQASR